MKKDDYKIRIERRYQQLSKAEKRLADLITSLPGSPIGYSATELAHLAGVSKAITSHLFHALGYENFNEFKEELRRNQNWGSPAFFELQPSNTTSFDKSMVGHIQQDIQNLQKTLDDINPKRLEQAIDAIQAARKVYVCGFRNSFIHANYLSRQLILLRDSVIQLPFAGQTIGDDLIDMNSNDVLIMIGLRRRVKHVYQLLKLARKQNTKSLYITDPTATRTAKLATWCFKVEISSDTPFDSYVSTMSLLNLVCTRLFQRDIKNGFKRIHRSESLHHELNELDTYKLKVKK